MAGSPAWSNAYLRRAAELWDARVGDAARAEVLYARLHMAAPADAAVAMVLARLRILRGAASEAAHVLETTGRARGPAGAAQVALAARASEIDGESAETTIARWREAAEASGQRGALEALARAYRRARDQAALQVHLRAAGHGAERRRAARRDLLRDRGRAGARGRRSERRPRRAFNAAADRDPDDLLVHAGRVMLYRKHGKWQELATALKALIGLVRAKAAQARLHRQLARVAGEHLGDQKTAHEHYEKALELQPDDVTTLHAFARLLGEGGKWARAVELRETAAKSAAGTRAAALLCEIGDIYEKRLSDDDSARRSYERALERDEQVAWRRWRRWRRCTAGTSGSPELLDVLRRELKLATATERQLELHLEMARAADQADGGDLKAALGAYREALQHRSGQRGGAVGPRAAVPARGQLGRAGRGAQARAAQRAHRARVVRGARAPRALGRAGRVARGGAGAARGAQGDRARGARARRSVRAAARTIPTRRRAPGIASTRPIRAIRRRRARSSASTSRAGASPIWRRPSSASCSWKHRWSRRGASSCGCKLGEIRKARLSRPESAAEAFENALKVDSHHGDALASLAEIYSALKRGDELNRVLDLRALATTDPQQRASVLSQKGDLLERNGDLDGALAAYTESFKLDPSSRTCFTAFERVCYRREKWRQAMELYETAIRLVEVQRSRAYRLADLYARRGQLQLQYLGQPGEAAASYLRVLELDPEADTAQTALERIFSAQSDWPGLIGAYERRAELVRDDVKRVEILRRAARVAAAKLKDAVEAARLYQRLHSVDPTDSEGLDALERHYERTRDWEKLVGILTTRLSLTAGGDEAIALYLRIAQMCEEGLRDADRAIESYRKILDIAPSHKEAIEALGRLYEGTERWAELVEVTRRQIRIVNDRAQKAILYFKCGSVMESKFGKEDDAIRYYDAAIKTSPSCLPAVHGLRDLYLRKEDWPRVIQTLELEAKLWTEDKERAGVFAHIGQIYGDKLGDQERAIQYYESALTVDRECLPANRALFELYFARGEFQRALPIAVILTQKVTREGDPVERSEFYRKRAVVAEKTGDLRAAAESLVVALEIRPENGEALELLVSLCRAGARGLRLRRHLPRAGEALPQARRRLVAGARARGAGLAARARVRDRVGRADLPRGAAAGARRVQRRRRAGVAARAAAPLRRGGGGARGVHRARQGSAPKSSARYRLSEIFGDGAMDPARAAITLEELIEEDAEHRDGALPAGAGAVPARALRRGASHLRAADPAGGDAGPHRAARGAGALLRLSRAHRRGVGRLGGRGARVSPRHRSRSVVSAGGAVAGAARGGGGRSRAGAEHHRRGAQGGRGARARGRAAAAPRHGALLRRHRRSRRAVDAYRQVLARAPESHDDRVAAAELLSPSATTRSTWRARSCCSCSAPTCATRRPIACSCRSTSARAISIARRASARCCRCSATPRRPIGRRPSVPTSSAARCPRSCAARGCCRRRCSAPTPRRSRRCARRSTRYYGVPAVHDAMPASAVHDPGFKVCVVDAQRLFGVSADVYVAQQVPGGVRASSTRPSRPWSSRRRSSSVPTGSGASCSGARSSRCGAAMRW